MKTKFIRQLHKLQLPYLFFIKILFREILLDNIKLFEYFRQFFYRFVNLFYGMVRH